MSYPKTESWKKGSDCCSWDGVAYDKVTGHVIGLDLGCSWLFGIIHSNSTLFLFPHLRRLNLASNDFNGFSISTGFGRFSTLTRLNLSYYVFSGKIAPEIFHLSNLFHFIYLGIIEQNLPRMTSILCWVKTTVGFNQANLFEADVPDLIKDVSTARWRPPSPSTGIKDVFTGGWRPPSPSTGPTSSKPTSLTSSKKSPSRTASSGLWAKSVPRSES
ncbi:receptor-like protein 9DC1 [Vitis vinifera]|uniref:receptor-like protein 9DC1 n=1 Tax=Vitis vinifera TaxID=29760 RepID=UPI00053FFD58|nr:receptor-like protein 9DC1 [Vitis vinifera]